MAALVAPARQAAGHVTAAFCRPAPPCYKRWPRPPRSSAQPQVKMTMDEAFQAAYTMSQLYVQYRPEPIPLSEHEARRKRKDMQEILEAARRRGRPEAAVKAALEKLETILPDLVNLNKMRASDWVLLAEDAEGVANKLITLKTYYPRADIFAIIAARPKTLMTSTDAIQRNAEEVRRLLQGVQDPDAIIQAVPELMDAGQLSRSLAYIASQFPSQDPLVMLQTNPNLLMNQGESDMEDFAEYGELSTKD